SAAVALGASSKNAPINAATAVMTPSRIADVMPAIELCFIGLPLTRVHGSGGRPRVVFPTSRDARGRPPAFRTPHSAHKTLTKREVSPPGATRLAKPCV